MSQFHHGTRSIEDTSGARPVRLANSSVIGLLGTANDSQAALAASLIVNAAGVAANKSLELVADTAGANGNAITIKFVDPNANDSNLTVTVLNNAITVSLATDSDGDITSTAGEVITAINGDPAASALVTASNHSTSDGSGVIEVLNSTNLAGGEDEPFPLDTPVLVRTNDRTKINKLGIAGTLPEALEAIESVTSAVVVVVRVNENADVEVTKANMVGNATNRTGWHALRDAKAQTSVTPRILIAPYYTQHLTVATEGLAVADRLGAIILIDSDNTGYANAITYSKNFGLGRNPVCHPWDKNLIADGSIVARAPSARSAGMMVLSDKEQGFWTSFSNRQRPGIVGTTENIDYGLNDTDSLANLLNENGIVTTIKTDAGYVNWGNRSNSLDPKYSFIQVRRTADMIDNAILEAHMWAVDRNLTGEFIESVVQSVRQFLRRLEAIDAIVGGDCWVDPDLNTADSLADGKLFINYEFTPNAPAESITFIYSITDRYFADVLS